LVLTSRFHTVSVWDKPIKSISSERGDNDEAVKCNKHRIPITILL
jgi:hypothetical protein